MQDSFDMDLTVTALEKNNDFSLLSSFSEAAAEVLAPLGKHVDARFAKVLVDRFLVEKNGISWGDNVIYSSRLLDSVGKMVDPENDKEGSFLSMLWGNVFSYKSESLPFFPSVEGGEFLDRLVFERGAVDTATYLSFLKERKMSGNVNYVMDRLLHLFDKKPETILEGTSLFLDKLFLRPDDYERRNKYLSLFSQRVASDRQAAEKILPDFANDIITVLGNLRDNVLEGYLISSTKMDVVVGICEKYPELAPNVIGLTECQSSDTKFRSLQIKLCEIIAVNSPEHVETMLKTTDRLWNHMPPCRIAVARMKEAVSQTPKGQALLRPTEFLAQQIFLLKKGLGS